MAETTAGIPRTEQVGAAAEADGEAGSGALPDAAGRRGRFGALSAEPGPARVLEVSTFINMIGSGMLMTASVLYFTRVEHLSAALVGLGLTLAGLVGIVAGVPVGDLADRRGPREVQLILLCIMAATTTAYLFIHGFALFVLVVAVDQLANNAANAVRGGLIRRVGGEGASAFRARLRAVTNAGIGIGTLCAAAAIQWDTPTAYRALIIADAASFLFCALIQRRLPHLEPLPRPKQESRWGAVRDLPFNAWAAVNGMMSIQYAVLLIPLPLWIVGHTHAPRWSVACCLLINTVMCVCFQVKGGRTVETPKQGAAAFRTAGLLFLISCPLLGLLDGLSAWAAVLLLVLGCAVHTTGELWQASGAVRARIRPRTGARAESIPGHDVALVEPRHVHLAGRAEAAVRGRRARRLVRARRLLRAARSARRACDALGRAHSGTLRGHARRRWLRFAPPVEAGHRT